MSELRHFPGKFPYDRELTAKKLWRVAFNDKEIR